MRKPFLPAAGPPLPGSSLPPANACCYTSWFRPYHGANGMHCDVVAAP
jgi:hypothetical protein